MIKKSFLLPVVLILALTSCRKEDEIILDPETETLVTILKDEMYPLSKDPLSWSDDDLAFLDPMGDKSVVALGEATHGTAQFFRAKHRIFRYLVENHGYRIFAIEADFGESLLINEAVQAGESGVIEDLMKDKMHFWTWRTEEVRDLIEWMCDYNLGRPDKEKLQYMGFDCQFNTYHPQMVLDYLSETEAPFYTDAEDFLQEVRSLTENRFSSWTTEDFNAYLQQIDALQDSLTKYEDNLVQKSSEKDFKLHVRLLRVIRQVSEVMFAITSNDSSINYRDKYMAENTEWMLDYFDGEKIVLWAHNFHISNQSYMNTGSMGYYLYQQLLGDYGMVGFLFARGSFTARGMEGEQYTSPGEQTIDTLPRTGSLNALMYYTQEPAFSVRIGDLLWQPEWSSALNNNMEYFQLGAGYNNKPGDYYSIFDPDWFDWIIFFRASTATVLL